MERTSLIADFRRAVRAKIARDLVEERALAEARVAEVLPALRAAVGALRTEGRLREAWLFGSYAWGRPIERSDVDLLVATDESPFAIAAALGQRVGRMVHVVLLATAPATLIERARTDGVAL